jgi:hypothetical protein
LSSRVRQLLNKAELCFRFAGTLGNQAEAERLETLVLGHCYLEEADRVAASDEQRYRAQNAIPNRARAVPAEELDAGFQDRPDRCRPTPNCTSPCDRSASGSATVTASRVPGSPSRNPVTTNSATSLHFVLSHSRLGPAT